MDSYRVERRDAMKIAIADEDGEIDPVPVEGGGHLPEAELDPLSVIIQEFNERFGNIPWQDEDRVYRLLKEDIPRKVKEDAAFRHAARNSDRQNARIEHAEALKRVMTGLVKDDMQLFRQFMDNESFRRWLTESRFRVNYDEPGAS